MVIEIEPHSRDNFNNLSTMTLKHQHGKASTPSRAVNRYDFNAKTNVGADIPLMNDSGIFMLEENVNPEKLRSIMGKNGFLENVCSKYRRILERIGEKNLKMFYPSFTKECLKTVGEYSATQKAELVRFFCNAANELELESLVLPNIYGINEMSVDVSRFDLQLIPSLNMREETANFEKNIQECAEIGCNDIPIIACQFARYPAANKAYDHVMKKFDPIHERNQAIMLVGVPRAIQQGVSKRLCSALRIILHSRSLCRTIWRRRRRT